MTMKTNTFLTVTGLAALAILGGCRGGGGSNEILATVQGDPITIDQFNNYLGVKPTARVIVQGQVAELPVADTLAFQAMQDLVSRTVLFQMAKDEGIDVNMEAVNKEIDFQKELDPNFLTGYQRRGMTIAQIREEVKFSVVQEKLITKGIDVSDEEVDLWLKNNPQATIQPATVEMTWIFVATEEKRKEAENAIKSGEKFADVAVKHSQAPNAAMVKGRYAPERGPIPVNQLSTNLRPAVEKANEGQETPWIKFSEGYAIFHIDKKTPQKPIEVTSVRKENVRRNLAIQRGSKANDLRKRLVDRIRTSDIVVRRESLKEAWKSFADLLQKQAEQAAQQAGPAVGGDSGSPAPEPTK